MAPRRIVQRMRKDGATSFDARAVRLLPPEFGSLPLSERLLDTLADALFAIDEAREMLDLEAPIADVRYDGVDTMLDDVFRGVEWAMRRFES